MLRTSVRNMLAHRRRLAATAVAVILGVALVAGTLVLTDTISQTFSGLYTTVYQGTDAVVRAQAAFTGIQGSGAQRPPVNASLVATLRTVPGVAADDGVVRGYARLVGSNGQALGNPTTTGTIGRSWPTVGQLNPWVLAAGRPPRAGNEIVIDQKSASDGHLAVGGTATVLVQGPPRKMLITGIARFGNASSPGGTSVILFTVPAAQQLVGQPGKFDSILFAAQPGVSQTRLARNLQAALPAGLEAVTGQQAASEARSNVMNQLGGFNTLLMVLAVAALMVGAFQIFNTFSITVAQRTRENGLLRALGATRRQILSSVLLEAVAVGLLASAVGLGLGVAVAAGLKALLAATGLDIPAGGIVFAPRTVIIALLAGTAVTVAAALSPARKAAKVPPVAAMQDAVATSTGYGSKQRVFVGTGVLALGAAVLFTGLLAHPSSPVLFAGAGAVLVFFAVAILGRTVSLPISRVLGAPLPSLRGVPGTIARQNAMRNPKRTAAAASALMICVGLVSFITMFTSSVTEAANTVYSRAFTGDFIINSGAGGTGGVDPGLARRVSQLPQVALASGARVGMAKIEGGAQQVVAVDPKTAFGIFDVQPLQGNQNDLGRDAIAVYKTEATDHHLKIGDHIPVAVRRHRHQVDAGRAHLRLQPAGRELLPRHQRLPGQLHQPVRPAGVRQEGARRLHRRRPGRHQDRHQGLPRHHGPGPGAVQSPEHPAHQPAPQPDLRPAAAGRDHRPARHRQHPRAVHLRADPGDRPAPGGRHDTTPAALDHPAGIGRHRPAGHRARAAHRRAVRLGHRPRHQHLRHRRRQHPLPDPGYVVILAAIAGVVTAIRPARRAAKLNILRAIVTE